MKKVVTIVGARPQFVKASVVSRVLRKVCTEVLVHTGQHYDDTMSGVFFRELGIPEPDVKLGVGSGPHGKQTGEMLAGVEDVLLREHPDWVLVYGDTNSTLAGSLAAAKLNVPVAHVEAGVRSYNRRMPEEVNRVLTDRISNLLLCPNDGAVRNLALEGIFEGVHCVGDVMLDALMMFKPSALKRTEVLDRWGVKPGAYALLTLHRAENVDDPVRLGGLLCAIGEMGLPVVFPVHPRTGGRMRAAGLDRALARCFVVGPPVGYVDAITLAANASVVLTDSGGLQREACYLGTPCVVLRNETEWPELVMSGRCCLAGPDLGAHVGQRWAKWRSTAEPVSDVGQATQMVVGLLGASGK